MATRAEKLRKDFKASDDIRDAGLTTPDDIIRYDDICYGTDAKQQSLDVYRPRAMAGQTLPVIVSVHGGGWVYGDKELYQYYCMSLAQRGFAVINFTYRLAPENRFPACLEDTCAVFAWVQANAAAYGLDTAHVFALGDSAGAHILTLYCEMAVNPAYAAKYSFSAPAAPKLKAIALNCGAYEVERAEDKGLMTEVLPTASQAEYDLVSPLLHLTGDFPPCFIMTATGDFLAPQAPVLAQHLTALQVPYVLRYYGTAQKPLGHVFHVNMRLEEGRRCNDDECAFFREFC